MGEREEGRGQLRGLDPGHARDGEGVAFGEAGGRDRRVGGGVREGERAVRGCAAGGGCFGGDVDHVCGAGGVEVGEVGRC